MSEPTPEAVEAAARAMFADMCCDSENPEVCATQWDDALDQEMWLEQAAAALSAAAPYLIREAQAQALEEAADAWWAHIRAIGLGSRAPIHWLRARAAAIRDGAQ